MLNKNLTWKKDKMKSIKLGLLTGLLCGIFFNPALSDESKKTQCDIERPIVFAGFDWDSARLHNSVARFILEKGYGCKTDEIPGTTVPLFNGMARGEIDVSMEVWKQAVVKVWEDHLKDGSVVEIGTNFDDAVQGIFIPKWLVEGKDAPAPDLKTVADLAKYKDLFKDKEQPSKGRFYNCMLGWSCAAINTKKLGAYGLADDFVDFRPGAAAAVSTAVETAMLRKKPIVFYYWTPSWLIGRFANDLIMLEEPAYDEAIWKDLSENDKPEKATAYPLVSVLIGANAKFAKESPVVIEFLRKYKTQSNDVSAVLDYMRKNKTDALESANYFLKTYPDTWTKWVPADVAERVKAAL